MEPHIRHLRKDKVLQKALPKTETIQLQQKGKLHLALCSSIIGQQLSTKVAAVIYARFLALFKSATPAPATILKVDVETLRSIGLSYSKVSYIHNVCTFFIDNKLTDAKLSGYDDEALIELLTQIKGVGRWTAEMILMFALGREDVFAADDLGIQQAMILLYDLDKTNKKQMLHQMQQIAENWRPYRSYACRYLWKYKDA